MRTTGPMPVVLLAYAAAIWAFIFAAISFYWAAGGTIGAATLGDTISSLSQDSWFIVVVWLTGLLKVIAGILALMLVYPPKRYISYRLIRLGVWVTGFILTLYGGGNLAVRGLMGANIIKTPAAMHSTAGHWHLFLWDPYWLLGGILFLSCVWLSRNSSLGFAIN